MTNSTTNAASKVLVVCAVVSFCLMLAIYSLVSGRSPLPRFGYALFISIASLVLTLIARLVFKLSGRLSIIVYAIIFAGVVSVHWMIR